MKVDSELRLVLPLRTHENGAVLSYVYHTPISFQVFEANYRTLAATKAALFGQGPRYAYEVGARVATLRLRDEGKNDALQRGDLDEDGNPQDGGVTALISEIRRLSMVALPGGEGWEATPVDVALQRKAIDEEDWREVESAIVFFTCSYFLTNRSQRAKIAGLAASLSQGSITSLPLTEWTASLPKSTGNGPSPGAAA